jgi:hypothetical protein
MTERGGGSGDAGVADENVKLAVPFVQRRPEPGDSIEIGETERYQCRGATSNPPWVLATAMICAPRLASAQAVA